jgi:hypothetical protein
MKAKQLELFPPPGSTHRYQILDALSDAEEARLDIPTLAPQSRPQTEARQTRPMDISSHHYGLPTGNPYSCIGEEDNATDRLLVLTTKPQISAKAFAREATRILRQYSPTVGKNRRLRPEFSEFVANQISKPPTSRYQVLAELKKYDLSISGYAEPLFNREISDQILNKLLRIGAQ